MNFKRVFFVVLCLFGVIGVSNVAECALPFGIFPPILTSGWYYKPSPVESVIFGLIVVKILSIRLASVTGILPIPYHLNDLFVRNLGKRSLPEYFTLGLKNLTMPQSHTHVKFSTEIRSLLQEDAFFGKPELNETAISPVELKAMYRLLLGVRRLDTNDCFLKSLCILGHQAKASQNISLEDQQLVQTIRYLTLVEEKMQNATDHLSKPYIMDVFNKALLFGIEESTPQCGTEYSTCPLAEGDMNFESVMSDL